jgi:hypothetical protein
MLQKLSLLFYILDLVKNTLQRLSLHFLNIIFIFYNLLKFAKIFTLPACMKIRINVLQDTYFLMKKSTKKCTCAFQKEKNSTLLKMAVVDRWFVEKRGLRGYR